MTRTATRTAVIVVALCSWACGSSSGRATTPRTFRSTTYGYSIELPSGWSAVGAKEGLRDNEAPVTGLPVTDIFARRATRRIRQLTLPALVVGAQHVSPTESLQSWTARVITLVGRFKGCPAPAATERTTLGGHDAALLTYPNCPAGQHLYHLWTVAVVAGRGFQFVWFNTPGSEVQDRLVLDRMLRSASFSK